MACRAGWSILVCDSAVRARSGSMLRRAHPRHGGGIDVNNTPLGWLCVPRSRPRARRLRRGRAQTPRTERRRAMEPVAARRGESHGLERRGDRALAVLNIAIYDAWAVHDRV